MLSAAPQRADCRGDGLGEFADAGAESGPAGWADRAHPGSADLVPTDRARALYRLSDPALSELGLDEFLDELLVRVRHALSVDTVAILLLDPATQQLVARAAKGIEEEVERGVGSRLVWASPDGSPRSASRSSSGM